MNFPLYGFLFYAPFVCYIHAYSPQIREEMSGPEISEYEKSILGCGLWSGLDCEIKGFGPNIRNF